MEDLDEDLFDEEFEPYECSVCGHGLIDSHLPGCPEGEEDGE